MATITDKTYYKGDIILPQLGNPIQEQGVLDAIAKYEPIILKHLLGYPLYKIVQDAWNAFKATTPTPLPVRIDELINGADMVFQVRGKTVETRWNGLANTDKVSLLSYFVHAQYLTTTSARTATTGQVKPDQENSKRVSLTPKYTYSWNRMVELYGQSPRPRELGYNKLTQQEQLEDFWAEVKNYKHWNRTPSAFNFLLANKDTYPEWEFKPIYKKNIMGL